ncbi:PREDICTED: uncharacterized protein LOC109467467 isoform X2 [Branchiostoma belcheri]|uniref:Uncharacterized protein LOC109467467 isoform X2 n=1 Tax=Branchiostoma belcheri TaxID=7741 RepID=A0A6P4YUU7_BRABE|nr:PREDICTED: uncharacterized protein LOC109467467 isoform X2 [Branchiostoma belcheri]
MEQFNQALDLSNQELYRSSTGEYNTSSLTQEKVFDNEEPDHDDSGSSGIGGPSPTTSESPSDDEEGNRSATATGITAGEVYTRIEELETEAEASRSQDRKGEIYRELADLHDLLKREKSGKLGICVRSLYSESVPRDLHDSTHGGSLEARTDQCLTELVNTQDAESVPNIETMKTDVSLLWKRPEQHAIPYHGIIKVSAKEMKLADDYALQREEGSEGAFERLCDYIVNNKERMAPIVDYLNSIGVQVYDIKRGCIELWVGCFNHEFADHLQEEEGIESLKTRLQSQVFHPALLKEFGLESLELKITFKFSPVADTVTFDLEEDFIEISCEKDHEHEDDAPIKSLDKPGDIRIAPSDVTENSISITWADASATKDYSISITPPDGDNPTGRVGDGAPLEYTFINLTPGTLYNISVTTAGDEIGNAASTVQLRTKPATIDSLDGSTTGGEAAYQEARGLTTPPLQNPTGGSTSRSTDASLSDESLHLQSGDNMQDNLASNRPDITDVRPDDFSTSDEETMPNAPPEDANEAAMGAPAASDQLSPSETWEQMEEGADGDQPVYDTERRLYIFTKAHIEKMTENFSPLKKIAHGAFGPVYYLEKFSYDGPLKGRQMAVKVNRSDDQGRREFMQELAMAGSRHPHLLPLFGICEDESCLSLVSPYMANKDLKSWIQDKTSPTDWKTRLVIGLDLISAIRYYHQKTEGPNKRFHCDVKSANVFLDAQLRARLGDPGLMREVSKDKTHLTQTGYDWGTPYYQDPFCLKYGKYHEKSDLYSAGKVLLELFTSITADKQENGRLLFEVWSEDLDYFDKQSDGTKLCEAADRSSAVGWPECNEDDTSVTQQFAKLIIGCLQEHPKDRITLKELYQKQKVLVQTSAAIGKHNKAVPDWCMHCLTCKPCPIPMACGCALLCSACMKSDNEALYCPNHHMDTTGLDTAFYTNAALPFPVQNGVAVIINNMNFQSNINLSRRGGAEDTRRLRDTFEMLGMSVTCYEDKTGGDIISLLRHVNLADHSVNDCFLVCIMSHGSQGKVYGSDGVGLDLQDLTEPLTERSCPNLAGKPKVFLIQACRGDCNVNANRDFSLPKAPNIYLGMATQPCHIACRSETEGNPFIKCITKVLAEEVGRMDLLQIMTKVTKMMNTDWVNSTFSISTLMRNLYFGLPKT